MPGLPHPQHDRRQHHPERPHVAPRVVGGNVVVICRSAFLPFFFFVFLRRRRRLGEDLWRREPGVEDGEGNVSPVAGDVRQAAVEEPRPAARVEQDVARMEVAVDDAARMEVRKAAQYVAGNLSRGGRGNV